MHELVALYIPALGLSALAFLAALVLVQLECHRVRRRIGSRSRRTSPGRAPVVGETRVHVTAAGAARR